MSPEKAAEFGVIAATFHFQACWLARWTRSTLLHHMRAQARLKVLEYPVFSRSVPIECPGDERAAEYRLKEAC